MDFLNFIVKKYTTILSLRYDGGYCFSLSAFVIVGLRIILGEGVLGVVPEDLEMVFCFDFLPGLSKLEEELNGEAGTRFELLFLTSRIDRNVVGLPIGEPGGELSVSVIPLSGSGGEKASTIISGEVLVSSHISDLKAK